MAFLIGNTEPSLQRLAVPAVCLLIAFLAYASQWLFANAPDLDPGPLTTSESYTFNILVLCLWYTYYKACTVDPGRYVFPPDLKKKSKNKDKNKDRGSASDSGEEPDPQQALGGGSRTAQIQRWCKKCAAPKPPRAHHCKTCRRCIPKMDHHCPWTSNCVSLQTFPHFLRFLLFANASLWTLLSFLLRRFLALWDSRHLPAYLGPSAPQLALLTALTLVAGLTSLALGLLLGTTVKGWLFNATMIETWEIERHEAALERRSGDDPAAASWWASPDPLAIEPVEFPYDVGVFANMAAAMGTRNPLLWLCPFAGGPRVAAYPYADDVGSSSNIGENGGAGDATGWAYEENGLNDREGMWPPPDPDKLRHARSWRRRQREADRALELERERERYGRPLGPGDEREAFRRRQERDLRRWEASRARILSELEETEEPYYEEEGYDFVDEAYQRGGAGTQGMGRGVVVDEGKSGWVNADGEHLGDYGVDSDAEFDEPGVDVEGQEVGRVEEDEDVPLAELIRRRKVRTKDGEDT